VYLSYAEAKYNVYFLKNNKEAIIGKKFYQLFTKKEKQKVMQFGEKKIPKPRRDAARKFS
jgi:hypothetical protein